MYSKYLHIYTRDIVSVITAVLLVAEKGISELYVNEGLFKFPLDLSRNLEDVRPLKPLG